MAQKVGNYPIPFNHIGDLLHYPESYWVDWVEKLPVWKDNFEFTDTLKVDSMTRGRSAAYFIMVSQTNGKNYPIFMKELLEMILSATVTNGVVSGKWTFVKRGKNYGISFVRS